MATAHTYRLSAYPRDVILRDGTSVALRPMERTDADRLLDFFLRISEDDRFYLKEDVTSPKVIQGWAEHLDYDRALPLLAMVEGRVVADGTLHRRRAGARRHIGEIRIVVDPEYRNRGLGTTLILELVRIAYDNGLERLVMEIVDEKESQAIEAAEGIGFVRLATLPAHAKDTTGKPQNIILMEMPLGKWYEWWQF